MIGLGHYLAVGAVLFVLGVFGIFLNRKNIIVILMAIELILLSVNINLVAFSSFLGDMVGQVFAMFVLTVAAGEAAIGLAILVIYFRGRGTIAVDDIHQMKGGGGCFTRRHCEERQRRGNPVRSLDCFAALAMTGRGER